MSNPLLFMICVCIWGSTWITIPYQLGTVDPVLSVAYRFALAAVMLGLFCRWQRISLRLPVHIHVKMAAVGLALYTLDYTLLYHAQQYVISALVALMSSLIIYFNVFLRRLLLGKPIRIPVLVGATLGLAGMVCIFYPEFAHVQQDSLLWLGISLALASFLCAAVGNVISERILDHGTPVVAMNFWAMSYGLVWLSSYAAISGARLTLPADPHYYWSLLYLSLFGSVLAFGAYMRLLQQMGSDKAAYVVLLYPLVALALSTLFEGYQWHISGLLGVMLVLLGNAIAMEKLPRQRQPLSTLASETGKAPD
ncbi:DMT family transporter [Aestuariibacter halophilus]|uniref:DMT family transporter n=1 Tax=Fluctibacter halophilus TaxID=226011 RepID=A0ABS8G941_9ALTE|nr:EamA family transporter [Aestuariibacter halophilus]MCC2616984.1 DMT family transporter [Aestuariibacter halophilus]